MGIKIFYDEPLLLPHTLTKADIVERADAERAGPISGAPLMAAAAEGVAADAAAVAAAVDASPLGGLFYFPTALVRDQLPVELDELGGVPTMANTPGATMKARLKKYALAIRRMAKVYNPRFRITRNSDSIQRTTSVFASSHVTFQPTY